MNQTINDFIFFTLITSNYNVNTKFEEILADIDSNDIMTKDEKIHALSIYTEAITHFNTIKIEDNEI